MPLRPLTINARTVLGDDAEGVVVRVDLATDEPAYIREGSPATDYVVLPTVREGDPIRVRVGGYRRVRVA